MIKIETRAGDNFDKVAAKAKRLSTQMNQQTYFDFNGVKCIVSKDTNIEWLFRDYINSHRLGWESVGPYCMDEYTPGQMAKIERAKKKAQEEQAEYIRKRDEERAKIKTKKFTLLQLFTVVDGRLSSTIDDVYDILNHVCNDSLMTHHLPVAMNYLKAKNPKWFQQVTKDINDIKKKVHNEEFDTVIEGIKAENKEYDIPKLNAEFDTSDFGTFMGDNDLLFKKVA